MKFASNNEIKLLRKLNRRKYREREKLFIAEGERTVQQILENGNIHVQSIFVKKGQDSNSPKGMPLANIQDYIEILYELDQHIFDEITDTENPQGIIALCQILEETDSEKLKNESGIIIATDAIQDPGNMGTIIRTAAWFGAKALLAGKGSVDVYHPKVVRSTAGATGSLSIISCELDSILADFEKSGWDILLLDGGSESGNLAAIPASEKTILVVGNEANGISEKLLKSFKKVRIEGARKKNSVESLNAAVALSIALFSLASKSSST